jgi:hypothetical protein
MCLECSGVHRGLGVHISFVRCVVGLRAAGGAHRSAHALPGSCPTGRARRCSVRAMARLLVALTRRATPRRSVTMDSWSAQQLKMMQAGGNDALNSFVAVRCTCTPRLRARALTPRVCRQQYGVPKETDPRIKYNAQSAAVYRDKIKAAAEGRPWQAPPVRAKRRGGLCG